ncbi:TolC family protein, partial [bacterium]
MNRALIATSLSLLLWRAPAAIADYSSLKGEVESYRPAAVHLGQRISPAPAQAPKEEQKLKAGALLARWEAGEQGRPVRQFYRPERALIEKYISLGDGEGSLAVLEKDFTLPEAETLAFLRNPEIKAALAEREALKEQFGQVEGIQIALESYSSLTQGVMTGAGGMEKSEPFPFNSVAALKGEAIAADLEAADQRVEIARRNAVTAARRGYWELRRAVESSRIMASMVELLTASKDAALSRYATGGAAFPEVTEAASALLKAQDGLLTMGRERENAEAMLREALGLPDGAKIGNPSDGGEDISLPALEPLLSSIPEKMQELLALRAEVAKMEKMIAMRERMAYPGYSQGREKENLSSSASMGGGGQNSASPKSPWFVADEYYLREQRKMLQAKKAELEMAQNAAVLDARVKWSALETALRERALYEDKLKELARAGRESADRGFSAGSVSFGEALLARVMWFEAKLSG